MAIDIENAVNTLYGTAPVSETPGVEAAEQTVGEEQQTIEEVIQQNIAAQSDSPVPEGIPDIPLPPQLTLPASYTPTFTIDNYTNFNITKLRNFFNINKYLEDPIAFIGNYVWAPNFNSSYGLAFDYRLPRDININAIANEAIESVKKDIKDNTSTNEIRKLVYDYLGTAIKSTLLNNYGSQIVDPKLKDPDNKIINNYFWFMCSQIFAYNSVKSAGATQFKINQRSLAPLATAFFMLNDYYQPRNKIVDGKNEIVAFFSNEFTFVNDPPVDSQIFGQFEFALSSLTAITINSEIKILKDYAEGRAFTNESNYYSNGKSSPATIESQGITSYKYSPFFDDNNQNISNSEFKTTPPAKEIQKCKNAIDGKFETGLRLFYKEGNDNILDKEPPGSGLGCQTNTLFWSQAKNIIFNAESLNEQNKERVNLSLPYYNSVNVKPKNYIPSENDIAKNLVAQYGDLAINIIGDDTFNAELFLKFLESVNLSENDVLLDTSLNLDTVSYDYSSLFLTTQNPIIKKLQSFNLLQNTFAYTGLFNVGYTINKELDILFTPDIQSFHIAADTTNEEKDFKVYDSQIRYGAEYKYSLTQLIYENSYVYGYNLSKSVENVQGLLDPTAENSIEISTTNLVDLKIGGGFFFVDQSEVNAGISFVDLPPFAPFLKVFPRRGKNDELVFVFDTYSTTNTVEKLIVPQEYWAEDGSWEQAKKYYEKEQGIQTENPNLMYFTDQPLRSIKVFASQVPPKDFGDLNELFKEVNVVEEGLSTIINIEPNTKYYFSTKAVSPTGLESFFGEIYEIEIVDDGGTIFPLINIYDGLNQVKKRKAQLEFGNKMRIEPALLQQAPNPAKNDVGYLTPVVFSGPNEERPQFKVRLTSKKTGKKVDFNIIYKKRLMKASDSAGELNLNATRKNNILISYSSDANNGESE